MNNKLKIGIIGTGVGLRTHYPGFLKTNNVEFTGLVGSSYERAKEFAKKFEFKHIFKNYQELISSQDVDLICITSPNTSHLEEILFAIENRKHILAEKPLAMNMAEINKILNYSTNSNELHLVDHQLRFNPYIIAVKNIIQEGKIGRPYFIKMHQQSTGFSDRNAKWIWSFDANQGGGVRLAMASHLIDILNFWFNGKKPLIVKGAMDSVVSNRLDNNGALIKVDACGFFSSSISFENNLDVQLSATAAAVGISTFDFSVYGTEGELHFDLVNKLRGSFLDSRGKVEKIDIDGVTEEERANKVSIFSGSFVYLSKQIVRYFIEKDDVALKDAAKFQDAVYTQILLDAIRESSISGSLVKLNDGYNCNCII